jgi:hypothetical protein
MEINFDVNLIGKISFRPSYHNDTYKWRNETITRKYKKFLWFKWENGLKIEPEGFYERRHCYYDYGDSDVLWSLVPEDYLIKCGYIIKDMSIVGGTQFKKVWVKSYVEVNLGYKSTFSRSFDTDQEAKDWIQKLKEMSGKTFEVYEYQ